MLRYMRMFTTAQSKSFSTSIFGDEIVDPYYDDCKPINRRSTARTETIQASKAASSYSVEKVTEHWRHLISNESVEIMNISRRYYQICKLLRKPTVKTKPQLSIHALAYVPFNCVKLNEERNFVDSYLLPWWFTFEPRINELETRYLFVVVKNLNAINMATNGQMLKLLGYHNLRKTVEPIFDSLVPEMSPRYFETFLNGTRSLFSNASVDDKLALKNKLTANFPIYVLAILENRVKFADETDTFMGEILFAAIRLGLEKPSNVCLQHILSICWRNVTRNYDNPSSNKNDDHFENLNRIASVFLSWKVDVNKFSTTFWPRWYEKTAPFLIGPDTFSRAVLLRNCLLVALRYQQENEFGYIRSHWLQKFRSSKKFLNEEFILFLINELKIHLEANSHRDTSSFKEVLVELESFLETFMDDYFSKNFRPK